jgi:hypothetical protein
VYINENKKWDRELDYKNGNLSNLKYFSAREGNSQSKRTQLPGLFHAASVNTAMC